MPKNKNSSAIEEETKEFTKPKRSYAKYIWIVLVLVVAAGIIYLLFFHKKAPTYQAVYTVAPQDVRSSVIATGTVTSETNLNLSFKTAGVLSKINVKVGDKVKAGQTLASLDASDAAAQVAVAQAGVVSAQVALKNAKNNYDLTVKQQQTLVDNAYATMLSSGLTAISDNSTNTVTVTISGTYTGKDQGQYKISPSLTGNGYYVNYSGLESGTELVQANIPLPLGTEGLYMTFSSASLQSYGSWTVAIPNTQSSTYLTNSNAYQAALQTQNTQVTQAQDAIDTANASLEQAKAQLLVAQNAYSNNLIVAPISGLVTSVDAKIGEQVSALKEVVVLLDSSALHVETQVPESSINQVQAGQMVDMTFDAFGPDKHLPGTVTSIDPASTVVSGVIDFRVVSSLPDDPNIKPGMTVNMSIIIADKPSVLAVPNRLISSTNGRQFVTVRNGTQVSDITINTGLAGDNFTEVTGGLSEGQVLVSEVK